MSQIYPRFTTADLCDDFDDLVRVAEPLFGDYGGRSSFLGEIETVRVFEDNVLVREALEEEGGGRVLVVDGGGSTRCALIGDKLASMAHENGWAGVVVNGCIRDSAEVADVPLGVKALHAVPRRSVKEGVGERGVTVEFAGISFSPGERLYADADGIVVAGRDLL
ncbi:MAG TPA: ribonuclease E activity regulator RraA [Rubrobacteraceae bacterium]|nr:ribonuclease E activity regulator RraA [Rubrobacteraceae bacterium]